MEQIITDASLLSSKAKLLTKKQMAAEMGVSYRTIERWYKQGYISRIRVGGRVFFAYSEVYRIRDQFIGEKPNGNYMESQIQSIDDIFRRQQMKAGLGAGL